MFSSVELFSKIAKNINSTTVVFNMQMVTKSTNYVSAIVKKVELTLSMCF